MITAIFQNQIDEQLDDQKETKDSSDKSVIVKCVVNQLVLINTCSVTDSHCPATYGQKWPTLEMVHPFIFCSLPHADYKITTIICDSNQVCKISEMKSLPHQCISV